jgi:hypothetical protein
MDEATPPAPPQKQNADGPAALVPITRTELVWPGKYNPDGTRPDIQRVNLPFQVIETINESRATREGKKGVLPGLFDVWEGKEGDTLEAGWRNKLIWGDNLLVMGSPLEKFAGIADWCKKVSAQTKTTWRYKRIDQVVFGADNIDTFADLLLAADEHAKAAAAK